MKHPDLYFRLSLIWIAAIVCGVAYLTLSVWG
jgi:hypothetical protein